jgi:predicted permease
MKWNDLRAEAEAHIEEKALELIESGAPPKEAWERARREFGNLTLTVESSREVWGWRWIEELRQDMRYAFRTMASDKLFTLLAVLSLALAIGANTTTYSFVESILLRSLPVHAPESLVTLNWTAPSPQQKDGPRDPEVVRLAFQASFSSYFDSKTGSVSAIFPYAAFERFQREASPFQSVFGYIGGAVLRAQTNGSTDLLEGNFVSGGYFAALGVVPAAGRLIIPDDDRAGAAPVVVLSHAYWTRTFGASPDILGKTLTLNSTPVFIIGVTPPEFFGVDGEANPALYLPLHSNVVMNSGTPLASVGNWYTDPHFYWLEMMARLKPGVTPEQAGAALAQPFHDFILSTAENEKERAVIPSLLIKKAAGGLDTLRRRYAEPLYLLMTLVGLMLAIACVNLANLLLARSAARKHEIAVRLSMGASRSRVIRQLLTESTLLACAGGILGTGLAAGGIRFLTALLANGRENFTLRADLNWTVLFVTAGVSIFAGIFFGLAPALRSTRIDLMPAIKDSRSASSGVLPRAFRFTLGQALIVGQVALSLLLLIAAGLFVRTVSGLESTPLGFNKENVLVFGVNLRDAGVPNPEMPQVFDDLRERFSRAPGVRAASYSNLGLFGGSMSIGVRLPGQKEARPALGLYVSRSFFDTMQIRLLQGEGFQGRPRAGEPRIAVVNELFAKTFLSGQNPLGQTFEATDAKGPIEIVGIAENVYTTNLKNPPRPTVYLPAVQAGRPTAQVTYQVKTEGNPLPYASAMRELAQKANANISIGRVSTQAARIDATIHQEILFAQLCSAFALLALATACVGLYGVTAYNVARRTREIGICMALGAQRRSIRWMVLRDVLVLAAVGLVIGVSAGLMTARFLESFLLNVAPHDPTAFLSAAAILLASALIAAYLPAHRASRIDPMAALRHE